jgi:hypothetical protein
MELRSARGKSILQRDSSRTMGTQLGRNYLSALKYLFANQMPIRGRTTRKDTTLPSEPPLLSAAGCDVLEVVPRIVPYNLQNIVDYKGDAADRGIACPGRPRPRSQLRSLARSPRSRASAARGRGWEDKPALPEAHSGRRHGK